MIDVLLILCQLLPRNGAFRESYLPESVTKSFLSEALTTAGSFGVNIA